MTDRAESVTSSSCMSRNQRSSAVRGRVRARGRDCDRPRDRAAARVRCVDRRDPRARRRAAVRGEEETHDPACDAASLASARPPLPLPGLRQPSLPRCPSRPALGGGRRDEAHEPRPALRAPSPLPARGWLLDRRAGDGSLAFRDPWGGPLPTVPRPPPGDSNRLLELNHGLGIDAETCQGGDGDRMDLGLVVDCLLARLRPRLE